MQRTLRDVRELRLSATLAEEPEVDLALVWPLAATRSWSAHKNRVHSPLRGWMEGWETPALG